ncbi:MAG: hypothetical protein IJ409_07845 [Lachnospiraceae bacterium]|nr:hypothetical protein [Lachnospiraceae bacterium]
MEDTRLKLHEHDLEYRKNLKWYTLSYQEITQAYLRIEEARGKLCCGVASFETPFLVLKKKDDTLLKIEASSKEIVKEILAALEEKNAGIEIGFKKED